MVATARTQWRPRVGDRVRVEDKRIGKGTTMYYPVEVAGALLSMGDAHMAQGDSELDGTGIETSITGKFKLEVVKAVDFGAMESALDFPLGETATALRRRWFGSTRTACLCGRYEWRKRSAAHARKQTRAHAASPSTGSGTSQSHECMTPSVLHGTNSCGGTRARGLSGRRDVVQGGWATSHMPEVVEWVQEGHIGRLTAAAIPGGLPTEVSGGGCVQLASLRILTGMDVE